MSRIIDNLDGVVQGLWDKGEISLNLKHYLENEIQKKTTKLLNKLELLDWESLDPDKLADIIYENIGDFDAR